MANCHEKQMQSNEEYKQNGTRAKIGEIKKLHLQREATKTNVCRYVCINRRCISVTQRMLISNLVVYLYVLGFLFLEKKNQPDKCKFERKWLISSFNFRQSFREVKEGIEERKLQAISYTEATGDVVYWFATFACSSSFTVVLRTTKPGMALPRVSLALFR